jgi:hypothetical protein
VQLIAVALGELAPTHQAAGTVLFAWNPLVLLEMVGNGHNDGVVLAFVLLAVVAAVRRRWWLAPPALAAAILIKLAAVLVVPFLGLLALRAALSDRRQARAVALGATLAIGLTAALYDIILNSPVGVLVEIGQRLGIEQSVSGRLLRLAMSGVVLLLAAAWLVEQWRGRRGWLTATYNTTLAYLLLASVWFWPWYVTWLLAPAALLRDRRRQAIALVFSLSVFALRFSQASIHTPPTDWMVAVPFMFGPPALLFVALLWSERRRPASDQDQATPPATRPMAALQEV